jgi:uncharacterized protein with PIN domain
MVLDTSAIIATITGEQDSSRFRAAMLGAESLLMSSVAVLERGRFIWPAPADGTVTITPAQLGYLLEGIDWRAPQHTRRPQAAG